jgi:hypothetical protein
MRRWRGTSALGSIWPFSVWRREARARKIREALDKYAGKGGRASSEPLEDLIGMW